MQAKRLELTNFRNYTRQSLEFGEGVNILFGDNAQGKTNVLEAVYLFAMGKGGRSRRDAELIRHGQAQADLVLDFFDGTRDLRGEMTLFPNRRKAITINEVPIRRNSQLIGRFRVVYFGPEYLGIVKEGPKARRKNIDILISQLRPPYVSALSSAKKLVESKNALLKMDRPNTAMLEILNEKLAAVSAEIIAFRTEYIEKMGSLAGRLQKEISGGNDTLTLRYLSCIGESRGLSVSDLTARLSAKLEEVRRRELDHRESILGPHREDIEYQINGQDAKAYASQGQQKTIVLAQKLAEVELIQQETGDLPVLLLDDIMSELDRKRQEFILHHIKSMQMLITCTDVEGFSFGENPRLFLVENGNITQQISK